MDLGETDAQICGKSDQPSTPHRYRIEAIEVEDPRVCSTAHINERGRRDYHRRWTTALLFGSNDG